MADRKYTLVDSSGKHIAVIIRRDKRLTKFSRWIPQKDGSICCASLTGCRRVSSAGYSTSWPVSLRNRLSWLEGRTDEELRIGAEAINRKYFGGDIRWRAIRWVGNMEHRLGSCSNGGPTDGHIRISERIKEWPDWVIDYVIAHELVHRLHANHSPVFWETLQKGYPLTERARGFIRGCRVCRGDYI